MEIDEFVGTRELVQSFREQESEMNDVCAVILKVDNPSFLGETKPYNINMFGKTMLDWVKSAVFDAKICYASYNFGEDFLPIAKNAVLANSKYTIVLFSDAPLFQRKTYLEIMDYFKNRDLNVLKLTRGYVFKTEYLLKIDVLLSPEMQYFEEEDFITCFGYKQVAMVMDVLKNRIITYHQKRGVLVEDPTSTFIDANVQIGAGTVIKPFCEIRGNSVVEKNVSLDSAKIENSVVLEGTSICKSVISNSFVGKNVKVASNSVIVNNSKIEDEVFVPEFCKINGVVVKKEDKLKSFCEFTHRD